MDPRVRHSRSTHNIQIFLSLALQFLAHTRLLRLLLDSLSKTRVALKLGLGEFIERG